jgi:hypothetical protein
MEILFTETFTVAMRHLYNILIGNIKVRNNFRDLDTDGNEILKWIVIKLAVRTELFPNQSRDSINEITVYSRI